jgi:hypothetical protein
VSANARPDVGWQAKGIVTRSGAAAWEAPVDSASTTPTQIGRSFPVLLVPARRRTTQPTPPRYRTHEMAVST